MFIRLAAIPELAVSQLFLFSEAHGDVLYCLRNISGNNCTERSEVKALTFAKACHSSRTISHCAWHGCLTAIGGSVLPWWLSSAATIARSPAALCG